MDDRATARRLAFGRVAIGVALVAVPRLAGRTWVGADAARGGAQVFARGLGARDVALGLGTIAALREGAPARPWLRAGVLSDLTDVTATWAARRELPALARIGALGIAGGAALVGARLAASLD